MGRSICVNRRKVNGRGLRRRCAAVSEALEGRVLLTVYFVDDSAPEGGDGTSWATAYRDLQQALTAAGVSGDEIRVGQGTYKPSMPTGRSATFRLKTGVALVGGYVGYDAPDPNARDVAQYATVLSGDVGTAGISTDNCWSVVTSISNTSTTILDGFIVTAGVGTSGCGMAVSGGNPTVRNCTFTGNSATQSGGGMVIGNSAAPRLANCTFIRNSASSSGGGLYNNDANTTLINCLFVGNTAGGHGGGVMFAAGTSTMTNCVFVGNAAGAKGGGVCNYGTGTVTLNNCTLSANAAIDQGGGIHVAAPTTISNCVLWNNATQSIFSVGSGCVVTYSDIQGGYTGTGNINADPQFRRIPSRGLDGAWGTVDDDYGDLRPRLTSPVIDAANNAPLTALGITTDLIGNPRFQDIASSPNAGAGTSPLADMGAYEAVAAPQAVAGGSYYVTQGTTVTLAGFGCSDKGLSVSYAWDLDADGQYDDSFVLDPVISAVGLAAPQTLSVALRVTDSEGAAAIDTATVRVVPAVYVDDSAPAGGDGSSWASAYTSLQTALNAAVAGQTIYVAQGTYKPTTDTNRAATFQLKTTVSLLGGYAGYGAADPNDRRIPQYASILSGDIGVANVNTDNTYHVVTGSYAEATAMLEGFTITGGYADLWSGNNNYGGGLYNRSGSPTIRNCAFVGNSALTDGGGMFNMASSAPLVSSCTFIGNVAVNGGGGGMSNSEASLMADNCVFIGNSARYGGAVRNMFCSPTFLNCTMVANVGTTRGGAMSNDSSAAAVLLNSICWGNSAPTDNELYRHASAIPVVAYCNIQGGYSGTGNLNADPQFLHNPCPGPDGKWGTADDDYGDLRLVPTSPCIDAGNNAPLISAGVTTDLTGYARFFDVPTVANTGAGTAPIVDMGAYETRILSLSATAGGPSFSIGLSTDRSALQVVSAQGTQSYGAGYYTAMSFAGGTGASTLTVDLANGNPIPAVGMSVDGFAVVVQNPAATDGLVLGSGVGRINGNSILTSNVPSVRLDSSSSLIQLSSLSLTDTGRLDLAAGRLLRVSGLAVADTARLDLGGSSLLVQAGSGEAGVVLARVTELLRLGRNSGAWSGAGIGSGGVLAGYTLAGMRNRADDGTRLMESFGGQEVDENSIIVTLGRVGDVDLSGRIDSGDYFRLDRGLLAGGANYRDGDLDYSGSVDVDDYTMMDWAFMNQPAAGKAASTKAVAPVFSSVKIEVESGMGGSPMILEEHGRAARATVTVTGAVPVSGSVPAAVLGRSLRELLGVEGGEVW